MPLKSMLSREFLDLYKSGKREFNRINLQFIDISSVSLKDVIIKDSKLFFTFFHDCDFSGSKFINSDISYTTFFGGTFHNIAVDSCTLNAIRFDKSSRFKNVKIIKSDISWSAILGVPTSELDFTNCALFKTVTDESQITNQLISDFLKIAMPVINNIDLDVRIRSWLKTEIMKEAETRGINTSNLEKDGLYGNNKAGNAYNVQKSLYGSHDFIKSVITAYNADHPYKTKKSYDVNNAQYW